MNNKMSAISKVRNKWKIMSIFWFVLLTLGFFAVMIPEYSVLVFFGLSAYGLIVSILLAVYWNKAEWYIMVLVLQIAPLALIVFGIRSTLFLPSPFSTIIVMLNIFGYIGVFFLPKYVPRVSYLAVHGKPESVLETRIYTSLMVSLGVAGTCGASIGIFGGRIFGWKILGVVGPIAGFVGIFFAHLVFYNLWEKRPWKINSIAVE
jgi:hypothetical protein